MTDSELRYKLLLDANNMLIEGWREKQFIERASAEFEQRPPRKVNPPTPRRAVRLAQELYDWVVKTPKKAPPVLEPEEKEIDDPSLDARPDADRSAGTSDSSEE
jgi:hypothetical protein